MSSRLKLAGICFAAAFALAACGGGGGTAEDPGPTPAQIAATAADGAVMAANDAVAALDATSSDADVMAAQALIAAAEAALMHADLTAEDAAADMAALNPVKMSLATVLAERQVAALQSEINALRMQLGLGADDDLSQSITDLMAERDGLQQQVDDAAEAEEADRLEAERMAAEAAAAAMAATAAKLYAGISAPGGTGEDTRTAVYADANIAVTIGTVAPVNLMEDGDAMVAARHGWQGQMFTAEPDGDAGTYEAVVYSNVGEPTAGAMISTILTDGAVPNATLTDAANSGNVASPSFDQSAGSKSFPLPDPNPTGETMVVIPGSYAGVSGTYSCTPTGGGTDCSASVAASGFTLAGGTWSFTPTDPMARLMSTPDAIYASYGWWIHKSEDGSTFTASAFAADRGDVPDATGITALRGTARYTGGAAGKYALSSSTGGTNDAGHFTADVTLDANFNTDMVSGTVDNFTGADGMSRNWSVELKASGVGDTGTILGADGTGDQMMTAWTIDGTAGADSGGWQGSLQDNGDDDVPKVATGTFYSTFNGDGKMVGAFGANVD